VLKYLNQLPRSHISAQSKLYRTKPYGVKAQPKHLNMVIMLQTSLAPHILHHHCKIIEKKQQRIRKRRWGARTIDIDILLYGQAIIRSHQLQIPHPQMLYRDFMMIPLLELSPNISLPQGHILDKNNMSDTIVACI